MSEGRQSYSRRGEMDPLTIEVGKRYRHRNGLVYAVMKLIPCANGGMYVVADANGRPLRTTRTLFARGVYGEVGGRNGV